MVFLPSHHHRVTSEKVMEYTGSCPHPTPRGQGTRLLSNDVEREYTSSLQGDIQLPYATQTTSSQLNRVQQGDVSTLGEIFYSKIVYNFSTKCNMEVLFKAGSNSKKQFIGATESKTPVYFMKTFQSCKEAIHWSPWIKNSSIFHENLPIILLHSLHGVYNFLTKQPGENSQLKFWKQIQHAWFKSRFWWPHFTSFTWTSVSSLYK